MSKGAIKPGPDRLNSLLKMPIPGNLPALRWVMVMFAHYVHWIHSFLDKMHPLTIASKFPLPPHDIIAFDDLKRDIAKLLSQR